ncbi:MAG: lipocalin family protein [Bacteroidales bacterium]
MTFVLIAFSCLSFGTQANEIFKQKQKVCFQAETITFKADGSFDVYTNGGIFAAEGKYSYNKQAKTISLKSKEGVEAFVMKEIVFDNDTLRAGVIDSDSYTRAHCATFPDIEEMMQQQSEEPKNN